MSKILLIDDDPMVTRMIGFMLKKQGHSCISAESGHEGVELIRSEKPAITFLDIEMPQENGIEVLKGIRSDDALKDARVCLMTGTPCAAADDAARELGAVGCIAKPVEIAVLLGILKNNGID